MRSIFHIQYLFILYTRDQNTLLVPLVRNPIAGNATAIMLWMRIVDFADMLQTSINEKIKVCKGEVHEEIEASAV